MIRRPTENDLNERIDTWQAIRWRMNVHNITPKALAQKTPYSQDLIERGIGGDPIPITDDFIRKCVMAFGLKSASRAKFYEETDDILSYDECRKLIKPSPSMPPPQGNFWDYR